MVCYVNGVTPSFGNEKRDYALNDKVPNRDYKTKSYSEKIQKEYRKLYEAAKKAQSADDLKLLEEKEKELEAEKDRLEAELQLERQKHTPEGYKNMTTIELYDEFTKAIKNKSPQLEAIKAEIQKRMLNSIHMGLAE